MDRQSLRNKVGYLLCLGQTIMLVKKVLKRMQEKLFFDKQFNNIFTYKMPYLLIKFTTYYPILNLFLHL